MVIAHREHPYGCVIGAAACTQPLAARAVTPPSAPTAHATRIVAVVNGDVISNADVDNRARLFAALHRPAA